MASLPKVAIIELGSQYTLLIERTMREIGVRSAILTPQRALSWIQQHPVRAIILSGGAASVYDKNAPKLPREVLNLRTENGEPIAVLGICYGMQWIAHTLGGEVKADSSHREYGQTEIRFAADSDPLSRGLGFDPQLVWASHGDSVVQPPREFGIVARSSSNGIAAITNLERTIWGVQFHPEVTHTPNGKRMLANFLEHTARCKRDWVPSLIAEDIRQCVLEELDSRKAIIGFSGGVDSTTLSSIIAPTLKRRLRAVTIDGGHLRERERKEILEHARRAGVSLKIVDAKAMFARTMANVTDAEEKRRRFKKIYAELLARAARDFNATAVIQGTLAPDRIESGATGGALIKSHHNVGLYMKDLAQIHPIDHLFKYEVRGLAQDARLPASVWNRQPFPGPGLFLRVVGTPATPEKLNLVRWADVRTREILERRGLYEGLSQLVVAYVGTKTVGVKGDARVYGGAIVVRAVKTADFMTAHGVHFPDEVEEEISRILTRHPDIVRVWYDPTEKPPATTELE